MQPKKKKLKFRDVNEPYRISPHKVFQWRLLCKHYLKFTNLIECNKGGGKRAGLITFFLGKKKGVFREFTVVIFSP